jgi:hypothetical protein
VSHELLERAFREARPPLRVNESCTVLTSRERATAVPEHRQSVQLEVPTRINLDCRTLVAEVTGVAALGERVTRKWSASVA